MSNNEEDVFTGYVKQIAFLGTIALTILLVVNILVAFFASFAATDKNATDPKAIAERLQAVEVVAIKEAPKAVAEVAAAPAGEAAAIDGKAIVAATCAACHGTGLLESPKTGDTNAWNARLEANGGMDGLLKSAIAGKGAMPARGGNAGLTDAEVKAAIEAMMQ